jgi:hypothetical protein
MPPVSRPVREARRLLVEERVKAPAVPVERIAKKLAHIVPESLPEDISGMLVPLNPPLRSKSWAIVVNKANASVRRRFTIAHELGHLLMHNFTAPHADKGFKVRFRNLLSSDGSVREEIEANQFAAELLMPEELLLPRLEELGLDYALETKRDLTKLAELAEEFGVSQQALQLRLGNLRNALF